MKKLIIILLISPFVFMGFGAQNSADYSGIAYYKSSSKMDFQMDDRDVPAAEQAKIAAQLRKSLEKEFELKFKGAESLYSEMEKLEGADAAFQSGGMEIRVSSSGGDLYKNSQTKQFLQEENVMGKAFLVSDNLEAIDWEIGDQTKYIGKYECQRASYMQKFKSMEINEENGEQSITETTDSAEVVAWFSTDIPIATGPDELWGLPGLILEVESPGAHIVCTKIVMNPDSPVNIDLPKKGKKVNSEELKKIREKKMQEMQKKYRGQGDGEERTIIMSTGN